MKQILLICLVALFQPVFSNEIYVANKEVVQEQKVSKNSLKIGYYVFIKKDKKVHQEKFDDIEHVYVFICEHFPSFCTDLESELSKAPGFMQISYVSEIYVEKQKVVNSKYKRLTKKDLKISYPNL